MIRTRSSDASLRPARNRPYATRSANSGSSSSDTGLPSARVMTSRIEIGLTPEEELICDRATD